MIGEGNVVQIVVRVVGIEGAPAAVLALHADDPFDRAVDRRCTRGSLSARPLRSSTMPTTAVSSTSG